MKKFTSTAIPLGIFSNTKYLPISQKINKQDILVLYTDGLTEAVNNKNQMFELAKLIDIVNNSVDSNSHTILENIKTSLNDFIENEPKNDDTTILITKFVQ